MAGESSKRSRRPNPEGVTLVYRSAEPVDASVRRRVFEAAADLEERHDFWAEPIAFAPADDEGRLCGQTELMRVGYESVDGALVEVDDEDDAFMAWMDLCVIVDWLSDQSARAGITWCLSFAGEPVGSIREGREDDELELFVVALGEAAGAVFEDEDDRRAEAIDAAHRRRA